MGNNVFSGRHQHNIDPKGRITIPTAYRETLGEKFTLGMNSEFSALVLYPADEWEAISERLSRVPISDARGMAYVRLIMSTSYTDQQLDGQGRLLLPALLRERAGLDKAIMIVGSGKILEIWDAEKFERYMASTIADLPGISGYFNERYISPVEF